jgi:hypothetical protein
MFARHGAICVGARRLPTEGADMAKKGKKDKDKKGKKGKKK